MNDAAASQASCTTDKEDRGNDPTVHHGNKKRGMKPRSKRKRKIAKSERHAYDDDEHVVYQTKIHRLELDGNPILSSSTETFAEEEEQQQQQEQWIRTVEPYPYSFSTHAKARWIHRTVLDVYCTEFGSYPESYYKSAIAQGRILVNDQIVALDYIIKGGDVLTHTVHRHEPAVAVSSKDKPYIRILQETDEVLVVEKPGTLPIHPCGGYHKQSLMQILQDETQYGKLYTIHRLDRLTSGLVILGKSSTVAQEWGKTLMRRNCQKVYLARVQGPFPKHCSNYDVPRICDPQTIPNHGEVIRSNATSTINTTIDLAEEARQRNAYGYWLTKGNQILPTEVATLEDVFQSQNDEETMLGHLADAEENNNKNNNNSNKEDTIWFHLACPTRIAHPKDGICEAGTFVALDDDTYMKTVKAAETSFHVIRYDQATDSTVVLCLPQTGRTHQIRLHLQHLGHPIANDPNYGGELWYGNLKGQEACQIAKKRLDAINDANNQHHHDINNNNSETIPKENSDNGACVANNNHNVICDDGCHGPSTAAIDVPATVDEIEHEMSKASQQESESIHDFIKRTCVWCTRSTNTLGGTQSTPRDMLEFLIRSPGIWLHALQYKFWVERHDKDDKDHGKPKEGNNIEKNEIERTIGKTFRTPIPQWARFEKHQKS